MGCPRLLLQSTVCPDSEHQSVPTEWKPPHSIQVRTPIRCPQAQATSGGLCCGFGFLSPVPEVTQWVLGLHLLQGQSHKLVVRNSQMVPTEWAVLAPGKTPVPQLAAADKVREVSYGQKQPPGSCAKPQAHTPIPASPIPPSGKAAAEDEGKEGSNPAIVPRLPGDIP